MKKSGMSEKEALNVDKVTFELDNKRRNETLTTELNFELLKQYAWFSSAAIGVVMVLIQAEVLEGGVQSYIAISLLSGATFTSIVGQSYIAESLLEGKNVYQMAKALNRVRVAAMFFMGLGGGVIFANQVLF